MAYEFEVSRALISGLITILVATLFVYFAAKFVLDRSSFFAALATAIIGTLLASLVAAFVAGILGLILAVAVWALFAAIFFRTNWVKGAIIGVVAWLLWFLVSLLIDALFR